MRLVARSSAPQDSARRRWRSRGGAASAAQRRDHVDQTREAWSSRSRRSRWTASATKGFGHAFQDRAPSSGSGTSSSTSGIPRTVTLEGMERIQEGCYRHGLKPVCLQGSGFGGNVLKDVTHKLWLMEQIKRLGARRVKFTGARRGQEGGLENVIATLKELAPAAEALDVLVLVENHANNNIETIEDYDRIFEAVPSRHVGMCLDMGHFDGANVDNFAVIERFHDRVLHVDMKDTAARGIHKVVNYGSGVTDVHGIVRKMLEHGYTGYLLIEQAPPLDRDTLLADMQRAVGIFTPYER
jgi:sugar phosphate isomerase/epimerase